MTLNTIIVRLKSYFEKHAMINTTSITLDDSYFNSITDIIYPVVNIQFINTDVTDTSFIHNFKIIIGDQTNPNITGIDFEIYSDSIQVAEDFFGYLNEAFDFEWIKVSSLQPFYDSNVDRISGVVFTVKLVVRRRVLSNIEVPNQDCVTPHKNN